MPWPVYSERFIAHQSDGPAFTNVTVPAGRRAVINDVTICNPFAYQALVQVQIAGKPVFNRTLLVSDDNLHVAMRSVAYAGEVLSVYTGTGPIYVVVCGFLLEEKVDQAGLWEGQLGPTPIDPDGPDPEWTQTAPT